MDFYQRVAEKVRDIETYQTLAVLIPQELMFEKSLFVTEYFGFPEPSVAFYFKKALQGQVLIKDSGLYVDLLVSLGRVKRSYIGERLVSHEFSDHSTISYNFYDELGHLDFQINARNSPRKTEYYTSFYPAGQPMISSIQIDCVREGKCIEWYENGQKKMEGYYEEDERVGPWFFFDTRGVRTIKFY